MDLLKELLVPNPADVTDAERVADMHNQQSISIPPDKIPNSNPRHQQGKNVKKAKTLISLNRIKIKPTIKKNQKTKSFLRYLRRKTIKNNPKNEDTPDLINGRFAFLNFRRTRYERNHLPALQDGIQSR